MELHDSIVYAPDEENNFFDDEVPFREGKKCKKNKKGREMNSSNPIVLLTHEHRQ